MAAVIDAAASCAARRRPPAAYEESPAVSEVRIAAEPRTEFGKGGARRTRRAGKIPAVLYGHGTEPRHIALPAREFGHAIKAGANTLLTLQLDGGASELALPKAIQRDPIRGDFEHVDLLLVRRGEKVTVEVRVALTGEATRDGLVDQQLMTLTVEAEATNIPDHFEVEHRGPGRRRQHHRRRRAAAERRRRWSASRSRSSSRCSRRRPPSRWRPTWPTPRPRPASSATSRPRSADEAARTGRVADGARGPVPGRRARQPGPGVRGATGTTSAPWSSTCSRAGSAGASRRTGAGPTSSRAGSARCPGAGSCSPSRGRT